MLLRHVGTFLRQISFALLVGLGLCGTGHAALYTTAYGTALSDPSDCDDCSQGPFAFGAGQSLTFFGGSYAGLYVGSNGYITLGTPASSFTSVPLDTQTVAPMIAGLFSDLDSRSDATSQVYVNTATPGQIVVTWVGMGYYDQDYSGRSTFQLVIRSDQMPVPSGEGQIGFFYGDVAGTRIASAGFGDGLAASNPGEVAFYSGPASALSNNAPRWYNLSGGVPQPISVPTLNAWALMLLALAAAAIGLRRLRRPV